MELRERVDYFKRLAFHTITADTREQVRQRANFSCEFSGISETDAGGLLTVD